MTKPFWTPEKKEEYNKLRKERDERENIIGVSI